MNFVISSFHYGQMKIAKNHHRPAEHMPNRIWSINQSKMRPSAGRPKDLRVVFRRGDVALVVEDGVLTAGNSLRHEGELDDRAHVDGQQEIEDAKHIVQAELETAVLVDVQQDAHVVVKEAVHANALEAKLIVRLRVRDDLCTWKKRKERSQTFFMCSRQSARRPISAWHEPSERVMLADRRIMQTNAIFPIMRERRKARWINCKSGRGSQSRCHKEGNSPNQGNSHERTLAHPVVCPISKHRKKKS